jgi:hypothetical protein
MESYSKLFVFFKTYKWAPKARVFVPGKHFQGIEMLHSSLLSLLALYKENEALLYSKLLVFFVTYKWAQ